MSAVPPPSTPSSQPPPPLSGPVATTTSSSSGSISSSSSHVEPNEKEEIKKGFGSSSSVTASYDDLEKGGGKGGADGGPVAILGTTPSLEKGDGETLDIKRGANGREYTDPKKAVSKRVVKGQQVEKPTKLKFIPFMGRVKPRDPYPSIEEAPLVPLATASLFSIWTFWWIQPLLVTGYQRTLVPQDLWKLDPTRESGYLADKLMSNFDRRRREVESWNKSLDDGSFVPSSSRKFWWKTKQKVFGLGKGDGRRKIGLAGALSDTFYYEFWSGGIIKVVGDISQVLSPLVTKAIIKFSTQAYYAHRGVPGYTSPNVGRGVGLAFALWFMQIIYSLSVHQFFVRAAGTGVLARAAIVASIYRRSMVLSGKARTTITNGKLINHISTDASRIDFCCGFFHMSWTAPIQLIIIIVILLFNLGPSCLAGIAFLVVTLPGQSYAMKQMFALRRKAMVWTDKRAKLIQELLGGMRVIKFFAWEIPYLEKLRKIRAQEMSHIRGLLVIRAANSAAAMSVPMLATVIAFLVYAGVGHKQNPAIIFTSLSLFNLLRMPLMMLPMSLSTITDAYNALGRLTEVYLAEEKAENYKVVPDAKFAVQVTDGAFQWEGAPPDLGNDKAKAALKNKLKGAGSKAEKKNIKKEAKKEIKQLQLLQQQQDKSRSGSKERGVEEGADPSPSDPESPEEVEILSLDNINLSIPKGQLCAIVGPVGSGKSSLLQALVGEMKRTRGEVIFGGSVAYCPQQAWIQNTTLKDNVLFGQSLNEERYEQVIKDACLDADLAMLPYGDMTEIGEKGITLSGGQKQRVNIARALYYGADVVLLDDPLSAVDAHVGKYLFDHAICGSLKDKTRILVTHALHFLPEVDFIICVDHGRVSQQGTYAELIADKDGPFSKLIEEFGGGIEKKDEEDKELETDALEKPLGDKADGEKESEPKRTKALMQEEERAVGAVSKAIYGKFFRAAKGHVTVPLLLASLVLQQGAQVLGSYWLVFWQDNQFDQPQGFYMGLYATFGILQALFSFLMGVCGTFIGYNASKTLHYGAIQGVMHAPMSFFDTSPLGRIMNRFSKDIDTIDNILNDSLRMFFATMSSVLGSIILIAVVEQWFLLVVAVVLFLYWSAADFYRASAREIKRLDNYLRSALYAHFSESLSGLATIRAYGESDKFLRQNEALLDIENRAYFLTVVNQRWLGIRLDLFGGLLIFAVAMFAVGARNTISPAQTGLILAYILAIQQAFSWMVRQGAEVENDMNSVERVLHYANELEQEAPAYIEATQPPAEWPAQGTLELNDVVMSYREGLPPVLKGLSLSVGAGEKIGVVGRTGAGKSSIMMALFRIVELSSGSIVIDGIDISKIGLTSLREKIAIIPQDALLFNGTIRSNLDPFGVYEDAVLWDALKRAYLVDANSEVGQVQLPVVAGLDTPTAAGHASRFTLDLAIEDEGLNLSVGERSLVSLARALVKDSRIIVLDEATASVDYQTDSHIQDTIRKEFKSKTLLCIAHRLRTIINYDRVLVMDAGQVAEFDTPLNLFNHEGGIFRSMCDRSNITEEDIRKVEF